MSRTGGEDEDHAETKAAIIETVAACSAKSSSERSSCREKASPLAVPPSLPKGDRATMSGEEEEASSSVILAATGDEEEARLCRGKDQRQDYHQEESHRAPEELIACAQEETTTTGEPSSSASRSAFRTLHGLVLKASAAESARVKRGHVLRRMSSTVWWASGRRWSTGGAPPSPHRGGAPHRRRRSSDVGKAKKANAKSNAEGEKALSEFMSEAGEPITWVEAREIWRNMYRRPVPVFSEVWRRQCVRYSGRYDGEGSNSSLGDLWLDNDDATAGIDVSSNRLGRGGGGGGRRQQQRRRSLDLGGDKEEETPPEGGVARNTRVELEDLSPSSLSLIERQCTSQVARGIKETYSIRLRSDKSELKFVLLSLSLLWSVAVALAISGALNPHHAKLGTMDGAVFLEAFIIFFAELIWECLLSLLVVKTNIKINYTRKLGHLMKVPKYFAADLLPFYTSTATSLVTSLAFNQTLFCLIYYRISREVVSAFAFIFLSQDRREDRPDTLTFQVTEDIMRFAVYFPFKLLVADAVGSPALVFIPIAVNVIGDGLAEPVGVRFGKHKYKTTALYYKGKFWNGEFTRSFEGSACVFVTTVVVVAINHAAFSTVQFWLTMGVLPALMTLAEAKAPHTNDGPFMALIGCSFLAAIFFWVP